MYDDDTLIIFSSIIKQFVIHSYNNESVEPSLVTRVNRMSAGYIT